MKTLDCDDVDWYAFATKRIAERLSRITIEPLPGDGPQYARRMLLPEYISLDEIQKIEVSPSIEFQCPKCKKILKKTHGWQRRLTTHLMFKCKPKVGELRCRLCEQPMLARKNLTMHMLRVHRIRMKPKVLRKMKIEMRTKMDDLE